MKKSIILGLGVIAIIANLTSCKKGENDPFLSLSSRKARLAGEWILSKETNERVYNGEYNVMGDIIEYVTTTNTSFDGKILTGTETTTSEGNSDSETLDPEAFTQTLTIEKDGTFKYSRVDANGTEEYEGNWVFVGKNKSLELKNKEAISLSITKYKSIDIDGEVSTESSSDLDGWVLKIDQLKKKEIVFIDESTYTTYKGKVNTSKTVSTYTAK